MPITIPAHQVAILPLLSFGRLPPMALVVGSCVPDLTYLWPPNPVSIWAHQLIGAALFSLSVGLLFYLWAELLLLPVLSCSLPRFMGVEWARFVMTRGAPRDLAAWGFVALALVLGAWSHVLLDSLTHESLWPGNLLHSISFLGLSLTKCLQYGLGLFGSLLVLVFMARSYPSLPRPAKVQNKKYSFVLAGFFLVGVCFGIAIVFAGESPVYLFRLFWSGVAWGLVGLSLACFWIRLEQSRV